MKAIVQPSHCFWLLGALTVLVAYSGVVQHFNQVAKTDPDRYFHLALARITANSGLIRQLPQVEHLGWGQRFQEKNFLFTLLTSLAYRNGGENRALQLGFLFSLSVGFLLYTLLSLYLPPWTAGLFSILPLATTDYANRVSLFRPHVLAICTFLLFLLGVLQRRKWLCFIGACLYALAYHALYVLCAILLAQFGYALFLTFRLKHPPGRQLRFLATGIGGILAGILLNPYFPQSLYSTRNSVRMALNLSRVSEADRPIEIVPMNSADFISDLGFYLVSLLGIWWFLGFSNKFRAQLKTESKEGETFWILLLSATLFWFLAFFSRRALEYAIPLELTLIAIVMGCIASSKLLKSGLIAAAVLCFGPSAWNYYRHPLLGSFDTQYVFDALKTIPEHSTKKVFNCEWDNGAYILYQRPLLHFIDITDPILLADHAPLDHRFRTQLKEGKIVAPYGLIHDRFKADYVLCDNLKVQNQLEKDPHFRRIYPESAVP